jgi:hypothetical protein
VSVLASHLGLPRDDVVEATLAGRAYSALSLHRPLDDKTGGGFHGARASGPAQDHARCRRRATAVVHVTLRRAPTRRFTRDLATNRSSCQVNRGQEATRASRDR